MTPRTIPALCARLGEFGAADWDGESNIVGRKSYWLESGGFRDSCMSISPQLFFSEADAITAFWFHMEPLLGKNFDTGKIAQEVYMREWPVAESLRGTFKVVARFDIRYVQSAAA